MSLDNLNAFLTEHAEDIVEFAVDQQRHCAYVVPKSSQIVRTFGNGVSGGVSGLRLVKHIPVTSDGTPDFELLANYQFVDSELVHHCQSAMPATVEAVAVAREYFEPESLLLRKNHFSGYTPDATRSHRNEAVENQNARTLAYASGPNLDWLGPNHLTMVDAIRSAASSEGGITYADNGGERFESYAELLSAARKTLHGLQKLGLKKGDPLPLQISDRQQHFHVFWGCALGGIIPVTIAIPNQYESTNPVFQKLLGVWKLLGAKQVLASSVNVGPLEDLFPEGGMVCDVEKLDTSSDGEEASLAADDVLFYQLTSGSTGTPKCIPETHAAIISHIKHSIVHVGYTDRDRTLNWLPFDHVVPMLTLHLKDVYLGCHAYQAPTAEILAQPITWLELMDKHQIHYSWSPNFGFKLVVTAIKQMQSEQGGNQRDWDLRSIKKLMNAGEQVTAEVCDDFLRLCGIAPNAMQPAFGMAEVCTCMTYANDYGTPERSVHRVLKSALPDIQNADPGVPDSETLTVVDLGPPSPSVEIRITEGATDKALRENQVGHLQIRGPCVMQGYFNNPQANAESFVEDGWFDSGDLGYITNGRLVLTGRAKEQIIVRGANFYAYEIEDSIAELEGCMASFVAATSVHSDSAGTEAVLIFFVPDPTVLSTIALSNLSQGLLIPILKNVVARIHNHVARSFGVNPEYVIPVSKPEFHKTTSGKIQRGAFRKTFLDGGYTEICSLLKRNLQHDGDCTPDWFCKTVWQRRKVGLSSVNGVLTSTFVFQPTASNLGKLLKASLVFTPNTTAPWEQLRNGIQSCKAHVCRIVYAWPCSTDGENPSDEFYRDLLNLGRTLSDVQIDVELYVVTRGGLMVLPEDQTSADYLERTGCLSGILKALPAELASVKKAIRIDVDACLASDPAALTEMLEAEFQGHAADQDVAIRNGTRYVKRYQNAGDLLVSEVATSTSKDGSYFRPGGAYVISGGLGSIGVEVVKMLLEVEESSVLIIGRSQDTNHKMRDHGWHISGNGTRVFYTAIDLGLDYRDLEQRVSKFLFECGKPLAGVFHFAGHYERKQISQLGEKAFADAIRAKVQGSIHLHRVLKSLATEVETPTFLHFGSVASFFAGHGLAAYSGSCAFQELFSEYQRADGIESRVYVWSIWEETGIGGRDRTLGFAPWVCPVDKSQGLFLLKTLLNFTQQPLVSIGVNMQHPDLARLTANGNDIGFQSLCVFYTPEECIDISRIKGLVHEPKYVCIPQVPLNDRGKVDTEKLVSSSIKALTATKYAGPQNEIEQQLMEIWKDVLEIRNLDRADNFFDLGGDSLTWMEMVSRANSACKTNMVAIQIMQHGTISELANHVDAITSSRTPGTPTESGRDPRKMVVELKKGSDPARPPLFLFPTVAGTTSCYNELLSHVDAVHPVVGIVDPYLVGDRQSRLLPFEKWMKLFADAVQTKQPEGPYTFMSYSQGATWLWGTVEELIRRNEVVERCFVLDPYFPGWNGCQNAYEWMVTWTNRVLRFLPKPVLRKVIPWSYNRMVGVGAPMNTERNRELSIAKTYQRYTSFPQNLWLFSIFLELDTGVRVFEKYSELKRYPKHQFEDTVDFLCHACAEKLGTNIDVDYLKDVMYVLSYSLLRASEYTPGMLPATTSVTVIAPARRGLSLCKETKLDQLVSPGQLQEIDVPVEKFEMRRHITGRLKGFYVLSELHFRCMHDQQYIMKCVDVLRQAGIAK